jgi:hypothetical protein
MKMEKLLSTIFLLLYCNNNNFFQLTVWNCILQFYNGEIKCIIKKSIKQKTIFFMYFEIILWVFFSSNCVLLIHFFLSNFEIAFFIK